jgi:hypothetical protein
VPPHPGVDRGHVRRDLARRSELRRRTRIDVAAGTRNGELGLAAAGFAGVGRARQRGGTFAYERSLLGPGCHPRFIGRLRDPPRQEPHLVELAAHEELLDRAQQIEVLVHMEPHHHVVLEAHGVRRVLPGGLERARRLAREEDERAGRRASNRIPPSRGGHCFGALHGMFRIRKGQKRTISHAWQAKSAIAQAMREHHRDPRARGLLRL